MKFRQPERKSRSQSSKLCTVSIYDSDQLSRVVIGYLTRTIGSDVLLLDV